MRTINWLYQASPRKFINHIHEIPTIREPFSDDTILEVQEKFLSEGFQYIKVATVSDGRAIIQTFLKTLPMYQNIGCLTICKEPLPHNITDIYSIWQAGDYLSPQSGHSPLEEYFVEYFYFDFIWIEATTPLLESYWFEMALRTMINFDIDRRIPILLCHYLKD